MEHEMDVSYSSASQVSCRSPGRKSATNPEHNSKQACPFTKKHVLWSMVKHDRLGRADMCTVRAVRSGNP